MEAFLCKTAFLDVQKMWLKGRQSGLLVESGLEWSTVRLIAGEEASWNAG